MALDIDGLDHRHFYHTIQLRMHALVLYADGYYLHRVKRSNVRRKWPGRGDVREGFALSWNFFAAMAGQQYL